MKISVKVEVSENTNYFDIDLDDLDMSQEEWDELSEDKRQTAIQEVIDEMSSRPYWMVTNFEQK